MTEDQEKVSCPLCNYFEIWDKEDKSVFFFCRKESCRKCTCRVCDDSFNVPRDMRNLTEQEQEELDRGEGQQAHTICVEYKPYLDEIKSICENQNLRICPECGVGGRKDGRCTHVECTRGHSFCYFCGVSFNSVKKSTHNDTN